MHSDEICSLFQLIELIKSHHYKNNYFTGQTWEDKVLKVREKMKSKNCGAFVVTPLDELACKIVIII